MTENFLIITIRMIISNYQNKNNIILSIYQCKGIRKLLSLHGVNADGERGIKMEVGSRLNVHCKRLSLYRDTKARLSW